MPPPPQSPPPSIHLLLPALRPLVCLTGMDAVGLGHSMICIIWTSQSLTTMRPRSRYVGGKSWWPIRARQSLGSLLGKWGTVRVGYSYPRRCHGVN
ncbi:hypothetical protein HOY82DRAFT_188825 [Tuber indicum]|nr:hypothetical protein HOY82DRAFT_188825 [Tuber indicum]